MSEENNSASTVASPLAMIFRGLGRDLIVRGIVELLIGIMLLAKPFGTIRILTIIIGALLIVDGVTIFLVFLRTTDRTARNWALINSLALLILGGVTVCSPLLMDQLWVIVLGVWQIVSGITELTGGGWRRLWGILSGVLSLIVGVIFVVAPFVGLSAIVWLLGVVLIFSGVVALSAGINLRAVGSRD